MASGQNGRSSYKRTAGREAEPPPLRTEAAFQSVPYLSIVRDWPPIDRSDREAGVSNHFVYRASTFDPV